MKRILAALLCLILVFGLVACGGTETPTDTGAGDASTGAVDASTGSADASDDKDADQDSDKDAPANPDDVVFDPDMEHKFIATDITNHSIVVYDLDACIDNLEHLKIDDVAVVWEWDSDDDPNCKIKPGLGIDSAKIRYSPYYECDVMIACSSGGWAGVIDYEEKSLLWEYNVKNGPHSIEMLPNGDVVVACSSDPGALVYVPLSAGEVEPSSSIPSLYCHGVSWDPVNEWLWVLEDTGVYCATVTGMGTKGAKLTRINGSGDKFADGEAGGHAFSPVYGQPGKYWASSGRYLWMFDSETETLYKNYSRFQKLTAKTNIKGIASFPDGTVVEMVSQIGGNDTQGWSCDGIRVILRKESTGKVTKILDEVTDILFEPEHREFYKVQPFTKDYQ